MGVPERDEIDDKFKWNLELIYEDQQEWEKEREEVMTLLDEIREKRSCVAESASILLETLQLYEQIMRKVQRLTRYASLKKDQDMRVQENQELYSRAKKVSSKASSRTSFIEPEIQQAGQQKIESKIEREPELENYRHYFDNLFRMSEHRRSEEIEELLAELGEVLGGSTETYQTFVNADLEFPEVEKPDGEKVELSLNRFKQFIKNPDRDFRQEVYEKLYDRLYRYRNTLGTTLENAIKKDVKMAEARNYDTAREYALDRNNIPLDVFDSLVDTLENNLNPHFRHLEMKKEFLDVDQMEMHDIFMPLVEEEPEVPYEKAKEHVLEAVKPMGEDYRSTMKEGMESGWIDVYENKGKRAGAYSGGGYDTPEYILMNYQDDVSSMYTLAHELGHSMHSRLSSQEQPYIYSDYSIFLAEIASTVNEALLTKHLLKNGTEEMKRAALSHSLENFRVTLYRETLFADFEHQLHKMVENGEGLTPDKIDETYGKVKAKYHEPVNMDERIKREWMRKIHFYYNYYVFQYSTGMSAALKFSEQIINSGPDKYLDVLRAGSSDYPLEVLNKAGIDMTASEPFEKAVEAYNNRLDRMEELV